MARKHVECVRSATGGPPFSDSYPEATGESFTYGALLTTNGIGQVKEVGDTTDQIIGVAAESASGVANTLIKVWLAAPLSIFSMSVSGTSTTSQSDVPMTYGVIKENGVWCINKSELVDVRVSVLKLDPRDQVGTVNGSLQVVFIPGVRAVQF